MIFSGGYCNDLNRRYCEKTVLPLLHCYITAFVKFLVLLCQALKALVGC